MSAEMFVEVKPAPVLQPVERRTWIGSDGSRIRVDDGELVDATRGACTFERAADGALRCLPVASLEASPLFSDPLCTSPMVRVTNECAAQLYERRRDDSVIPRTHVFAAGTPMLARAIAPGRICIPFAADDAPAFGLRPGNEVDPALFPIGRTDEVSAGRLVVSAVDVYGSIIVTPVAPFYDRALAAPCGLVRDRDEVLRCVPTRGTASIVFTDPACTDAIALAPAPSTGLAVELRDGKLVQVRRTTTATVVGPAFEVSGTSCVSLGAARTLLALGDRVPFEAFVAIRTVVE
jgi:hypothetical protein